MPVSFTSSLLHSINSMPLASCSITSLVFAVHDYKKKALSVQKTEGLLLKVGESPLFSPVIQNRPTGPVSIIESICENKRFIFWINTPRHQYRCPPLKKIDADFSIPIKSGVSKYYTSTLKSRMIIFIRLIPSYIIITIIEITLQCLN